MTTRKKIHLGMINEVDYWVMPIVDNNCHE